MQKCNKCNLVDGVVKSGITRGKQRFFCKSCNCHFTLENANMKPSKRSSEPTIIDIAKSLGVAPSTVSRALNGKTDINAQTRQVILKAALDLDYKPNLLAQSLHRGDTHTIGVVIPNIERPFFAGVLAGIQQVASDTGYRVMICQSNESHLTEVQNIQALISTRVDGLLISHSKDTSSYEHLKPYFEKGFPIVHFDRVCKELNTPKVVQQDFKGSFDLVEHLISQGCKRIGILVGPENLLISQIRLEGYKSALQKYGIEIENKLIFRGNFKKEDSIKALNYWLNLPNPPDGIYAIFYQNAIEMMVECKKRNIRIPSEIAFVGFGDELIAELFEPSLTVFHQFPFSIGETAARMLIENISSKHDFVPYSQTVKGELMVRCSSVK